MTSLRDRKSVSLTIFAWIEILIGATGSLLFMVSLDWSSLSSFHLIKTGINGVYTIGIDFQALTWGVLCCLVTFPFVIILILGAGTLLLKPWARLANIILIPILAASIPVFIWIGLPFFKNVTESIYFWILVIILYVFTFFKIWFLARPAIKEQFERKNKVAP